MDAETMLKVKVDQAVREMQERRRLLKTVLSDYSEAFVMVALLLGAKEAARLADEA